MTTDHPIVDVDAIGWLTETEMIEVDRVMVEDLGIQLIQMMENAGRNLAQLVSERFGPGTVTVLAGSGGNGGGGLVAARHLANHGVDVSVTLGRPAGDLGPVAGHQHHILERMGVPVLPEPRSADVVIDALIGYSLKGRTTGPDRRTHRSDRRDRWPGCLPRHAIGAGRHQRFGAGHSGER